MQAINITAYTDDASQIEAIKAVIKAFKISKAKNTEIPYNPEFVAMIKQGEQDLKNGKGTIMTVDDLDKLCK